MTGSCDATFTTSQADHGWEKATETHRYGICITRLLLMMRGNAYTHLTATPTSGRASVVAFSGRSTAAVFATSGTEGLVVGMSFSGVVSPAPEAVHTQQTINSLRKFMLQI